MLRGFSLIFIATFSFLYANNLNGDTLINNFFKRNPSVLSKKQKFLKDSELNYANILLSKKEYAITIKKAKLPPYKKILKLLNSSLKKGNPVAAYELTFLKAYGFKVDENKIAKVLNKYKICDGYLLKASLYNKKNNPKALKIYKEALNKCPDFLKDKIRVKIFQLDYKYKNKGVK